MKRTDPEKILSEFFGKKKDTTRMLIEGRRAILEAIEASADLQEVFYVPEKFQNTQGENYLKRIGRTVRLTPVSQKLLEKTVSTVHSQGIAAATRKPVWDLDEILNRDERLIVALDGIADPGNLGTIVRTCAWFGVSAILLGPGCVSIYNDKVIRSTVGAIFRIPCIERVDLAHHLGFLRRRGYLVLALDTEGDNLLEIELKRKRVVFVIGSEAKGIRSEVQQTADKRVTIPKFGAGESLNAAIATGIALSVAQRKEDRSK